MPAVEGLLTRASGMVVGGHHVVPQRVSEMKLSNCRINPINRETQKEDSDCGWINLLTDGRNILQQ